VTLQAKPGSTHPAPTPSPGRLGDSYRETPTQRGFGGSLPSSQHDLGFGAKKGVRDGLPLHGGGGGGSSRFRRRKLFSLLIPETRRSKGRDIQCGHVSRKEYHCVTQSADSFHRSNILFILSGSFVGLEKIIGRRTGKGVSPYRIEDVTRRGSYFSIATVNRIRRHTAPTSTGIRNRGRNR
jgi:hypothetical protein